MNPVNQTRFNPSEKPYGNCFAACVASILEVDLQQVLDDSQTDDGDCWYRAWESWLNQSGYGLIHLRNDPPSWFFPIKGYAIMSGKSPRGDYGHSVVALDGKMVHDPHPLRIGIESVTDWIVIYPRDLGQEREKLRLILQDAPKPPNISSPNGQILELENAMFHRAYFDWYFNKARGDRVGGRN